MLFSSIIFIFYFLPITMLVYYLIPKEQTGKRNIVLLVASLFFYSWGRTGISILDAVQCVLQLLHGYSDS